MVTLKKKPLFGFSTLLKKREKKIKKLKKKISKVNLNKYIKIFYYYYYYYFFSSSFFSFYFYFSLSGFVKQAIIWEDFHLRFFNIDINDTNDLKTIPIYHNYFALSEYSSGPHLFFIQENKS